MYNSIEILDFDSNLFNLVVAKLEISEDDNFNKVKQLISLAKTKNIDLLYLYSKKRIKENSNFNFIIEDERCIYKNDLSISNKLHESSFIQEFENTFLTKDLEDLAYLSGLYSRFYLDSKLDRKYFKKLYKLWIQKSITKEIADKIFVYKNEENLIIGMVTCRITQNIGKIGLISVNPQYGGRGIGKALISSVHSYYKEMNCKQAFVVTQNQNSAAKRLYEKCGYNLNEIEYIYHYWL